MYRMIVARFVSHCHNVGLGQGTVGKKCTRARYAMRLFCHGSQDAILYTSCKIHREDSVEDAVRKACRLLGRSFSNDVQEVVGRLEANWYSRAKDVACMSDDESLALGLPLRLKTTIVQSLVVENGDFSENEHVGLDSSLSEDDDMEDKRGASNDADNAGGCIHGADDEPDRHEDEDADSMLEQILAVTDNSDREFMSLPIEQRICPPLNRFGFKGTTMEKVTKRGKIEKYALSVGELTPGLKKSFDDLMRFGTERFYGAQSEPIAVVTAEKYCQHIRAFLGYVHRVQGKPLDTLTFKDLVPSVERDGVIPAFNYIEWLVKERCISVRTELLVLRSVLFAAKFIYHDQSEAQSGETPYNDLYVVKEFRSLINSRRKAEKVAPRVADERKKWLDYPQYLSVCKELWKECAGLKPNGEQRADSDVAWSLQRYLIFSILSCCPDRQRTLRELELGRTLFKEDGLYVIRHGALDYKTGKSYGERAPMVISKSIYPELEAYIDAWRSKLNPEHNYLFTQANGKPLTDKSLYKLFRTTAYRITGQRLTPHMVRDAIVTHLRSTEHVSERQLEALALYMGHSVTMQRESYDRRTKKEKVEPAINLLQSLVDVEPQVANYPQVGDTKR